VQLDLNLNRHGYMCIRNKQHRACPANGLDCGSLVPRSHNLTIFVRAYWAQNYKLTYDHSIAILT